MKKCEICGKPMKKTINHTDYIYSKKKYCKEHARVAWAIQLIETYIKRKEVSLQMVLTFLNNKTYER